MSPDSLLALAKEGIKPAAGVIKPLAAPKLKKLQDWAQERDLQSRLRGNKLATDLSAHLKRVLKKAATVKTIVFSQQALPLPAVYEPLTLYRPIDKHMVPLSRLVEHGKRHLIVDGAGMGKSTFLKYLILHQIRESDRIPILLELRRVPAGVSLLEAIANELGGIAGAFDKELLPLLLMSGRFVLALDGFDEIRDEARATIAAEIEWLASGSQGTPIIVTSRPETELPAIGADVVSFKALTLEQAKSLVLRYDRTAKIDVGKRLIPKFDSVPDRFLRSPLLLALLYRTFGFNNAISTSVSAFYDEVYDALYKGHDLTKTEFNRTKVSGLGVEQFRRLLRALSFTMVSKQIAAFSSEAAATAVIREAQRLSGETPKTPESFLKDLLLSVPLMVRDGAEIRFAHKTLAEFFAAEFVSTSPQATSILSAILGQDLLSRFRDVLKFVAEINGSLFRRVAIRPLAEEVAVGVGSGMPLVDTILFFSPGSKLILGSVMDIDAFDTEEELPAYGVIHYFHDMESDEDTEPGKPIEVAISAYPTRVVDWRGWHQLTEESDEEGEHMSFDFSELRTQIPLAQRIPLNDPRLKSFFQSAQGRQALAAVLESPPWLLRFESGPVPARVLTKSRANATLEAIAQEDASLAALTNLFGRIGSDARAAE